MTSAKGRERATTAPRAGPVYARLLHLLFVASLALQTPLQSTRAQTRIDTWTTDNGLPQNSVTGLTRTPDGYIWFTTNEGLVRFDGSRFKVFNRSNTPEISNNRMFGAFADRSGRVWMNTEDGAVLTFEKGVFRVVLQPRDGPSGAHLPFFHDPAGGVIFCVSYKDYRDDKSHYGVYRFQDGRLVPLALAGLGDGEQLVLVDREGGFWFAGDKGLRRFKDGTVTDSARGDFDLGPVIRTAYEDRQGSIWFGYTSGGKNNLLRIKGSRVESLAWPLGPISDFSEDSRGDLWISHFNKGVYRLDRERVVADILAVDVREPALLLDGLPNLGKGYLCPDDEGEIWVGTNQGLARLSSQTVRVFSKEDGLPEENVYPICEDGAGRIWAGIWQNSLVRYENGSFKTFLRTNDTYYPTSLFEDRSGRFWVGTSAELFHLDHGRLVNFTRQAGFTGETEFSVISQGRDGNLWFGTSLGLSLYSGGRATVLTEKDGLPDHYVIALLQARDGTVWVGTRGGLASIENGRIRSITTADGLASNYIRSLYEDSDGVLWVGSYDGGLTRLKDGRFTRFTTKEGLSSNGVFCILEDDRGWFWMNSNQGIYRVRKQELNDFADGKIHSLTSIAYNRQDGLLNVEGNGGRQPAGIRSRDGRLWFPTAQGIAVVDPDKVVTNQLPPAVLIEQVTVERNPVDNEAFQSAIQNQSEIVLSPGQFNLEIDYTGISFLNSGQVKFKYRLEGLEQEWNDVGTRRTAYYSYLPPGEYTFHVIAANRDGFWNSVGASVRLKVVPPFYKTGWFILLSVAAVGCLAWLAFRWRVRRMRYLERRLRAVIETMPAMTWTALPDGSVDFINRQFQEYLGLQVEEASGEGWKAFAHANDVEQHEGEWRESLATGGPFEAEMRFRRAADGEYRWFLARAVPVRDARDRVVRWYGVATDIEERKRAEERREHLRRLEAELAHINRVSMLGELTSSIAHEIRQPLAGAITNADACLRWLARDQPDLEEARRTVAGIKRDGERAADIITRVRSLYRKGASPQREPIDVNEVVAQMLVLLREEADRHSVALRTELADGLPAVRGDRVQLQQVLMNLMLNAMEAMKGAGGDLTIATQLEDGHVLVSVRDTGAGLPGDTPDVIFEAFYTTKAEGTGMGLSISRSIVESHGGRLWAADNDGPGATFYFTLCDEAAKDATRGEVRDGRD